MSSSSSGPFFARTVRNTLSKSPGHSSVKRICAQAYVTTHYFPYTV